MSPQAATVLEQLLRGNNLGWMIDQFAPKDRAIPFLLEQLAHVAVEYRNRIPAYSGISFSPETLAAEAERNPHKIQAFFQALAITRSPEMLVMVWRILQGLSIRKMEMNYQEQVKFSLVVVLARPGGEQDELESYRSQDINDAGLVRHFGIATVDGKPLFDGFFALRRT